MRDTQKRGLLTYWAVPLGASIALFIYVVVRALKVPFTIDEAATYLNYISSDVLGVFRFDSTNNHLLNTLLTKLCWAVGGSGEFALRLPNVLAYGLYLVFSFRIMDRYVKNRFIAVFGFFLLNLNAYVLDFFSLSRGYGLSLAFLLAALYYYLAFLEGTTQGPPGQGRSLRLSLLAASLAVLANYGLLSVYVSLVIIAFGFFAIQNFRKKPCLVPVESAPGPRRKKVNPWFILVPAALLVNGLVISQDLRFAKKFFEPVKIEVAGLSEEESQDLQVFWVGYKNEEKQLPYRGGLWQRDEPVYYQAVKFRCPTDLLDRIRAIEVTIGQKQFGLQAEDLKRLKDPSGRKYSVFSTDESMALERSAIPVYKPAINWRGDRFFFPALLKRILLVAAIGGLITLLIYGAGRFLVGLNVLTKEQFRALAWPAWGLGIFTLYSLCVLKSGHDLPIWGTGGHIWDTAFSLINNSFYGKLYAPGQERVIFGGIVLSLFISLALLGVHPRKKTLAESLPEYVLLAILVLSSILIILQNILFANPYLFGRTGLFLIPLFVLFFLFLLQNLARMTKESKIAIFLILGLITVISTYHFSRAANTVMTEEWRSDTDIKSALDDLKEIKGRDFGGRPTIRLGVYDPFYETLQYHFRRQRPVWFELNSVPPFVGNDFYLLAEDLENTRAILPRMIVIKKYPLSENVLLKPTSE